MSMEGASRMSSVLGLKANPSSLPLHGFGNHGIAYGGMDRHRLALCMSQLAQLTLGSGSRIALSDTTQRPREDIMKQGIHPEYVETQVTCTCGNSFTTKSTAPEGVLRADVCSACHPFYTGKQKILDTGGRVARFEKRYAKK